MRISQSEKRKETILDNRWKKSSDSPRQHKASQLIDSINLSESIVFNGTFFTGVVKDDSTEAESPTYKKDDY